jgi:hypothetical protein
MPRRSVGFGLGSTTETTKAAEARKPTTVPASSVWKLMTVNRAAATIGLTTLSRSYASRESERARV